MGRYRDGESMADDASYRDQLEIERRTQVRVAEAIERLPKLIGTEVEASIRRALADEKLRAEFWEAGYIELEKHAGTNAAQWLGRRLINILITAALAASIAWVVMTGRIK